MKSPRIPSGTFLFFSICLLMLLPDMMQARPLVSGTNKQVNNPDSLFAVARELAFAEKLEESRNICLQILNAFPQYHDAAILIGRTYAWESKFDEARENILPVLQKDAGNMEAIYAMIDVEMWSGSFEDAIKYIDQALLKTPTSVALLLKKAQALIGLGKEEEAALILNQILDLDPTNKEALALLNSLTGTRLKNRVTLGYRGDFFQTGKPWHLIYGEYARRTKTFGTVIARVNHARKFDMQGYQFELDAYPIITSGTYLYLNAGYSQSKLFPINRFGFEVFQALPASFEVSAGFRLVNFGASDLLILTGSLSKYYRKYYFSIRPYYTYASRGADSQAYYFTARRYFTSTDHHLSLIVGTGFSADDDPFMGGELYHIERNKVMLYYQQKISTRYLFKIGSGYQQYQGGVWGNKVTGEVAISYLF